MNETIVTVIGNVMDMPELRRTDNGVDVASFRVAANARRHDKETNSWVEYASLYLPVTCWRQLANNVVNSLRKGDPVVARGRLCMRRFDWEGQQRTIIELEATAVGHDLSRGVSQFARTRPPQSMPFDTAAGQLSGPSPGAAAPAPAAPTPAPDPAVSSPAAARPLTPVPRVPSQVATGSAMPGRPTPASVAAGIRIPGPVTPGPKEPAPAVTGATAGESTAPDGEERTLVAVG